MKSHHRTGEVKFDSEFLLVLAKAGDEAALGRLLERYRNYIGLLIRLQGQRSLIKKMDAEGLLYEIGLEIHRKIATFRGSSACEFLTWVRRMIGSILANQVRHSPGTIRPDPRLERALIDDLDRSSGVLSRSLVRPRSSADPQAVCCEHALILADALGELPGTLREVIILRNLERISFPEVARRMGCTEGAAKNVWLRALARLHRILEQSR